MGLRELVRSVEKLEPLDAVADWVAPKVTAVLGRPALKDILSGVWVGHPLHPLLTDVTIGTWASAFLLDMVGGEDARDAAETLIGIGLISAVPTAASGLSDWSDTVGPERRLGLVHAMTNIAALKLYAASWTLRKVGRHRSGVALGSLGAALLTAGGYLGGHLAYARGIGVDHTVFDEPPQEWQIAAADEDVAEGVVTVGTAAGYGVLLYRFNGAVHAIADRCSHAGGPLHEGEVDDRLCVTCPWHSSTFRLSDGSIVRGPATAPQRAFDVRIRNGNVEVRARDAR
ncbi:MAG: Rieske 2Fe-2S domain-containing protein [Candidatus Dormibacteria bacterium]